MTAAPAHTPLYRPPMGEPASRRSPPAASLLVGCAKFLRAPRFVNCSIQPRLVVGEHSIIDESRRLAKIERH